jgi:hypothetical protein
MNITSAQYITDQLIGSDNTGIIATINGQQTCVPLDPNNRHYAEIMSQVETGELTIQEAD